MIIRFFRKHWGSLRCNIRHLCASYQYSLDGLIVCVREEPAFRQELLLGALHFLLLFTCHVPLKIAIGLTILYVVVLIAELINTAIEATVNLVTDEIHPLAKKAKDCASAGVFCALVLFVGAWVLFAVDRLGWMASRV